MPGPSVAKQACGRPVSLASTSAMTPAVNSCLVSTNSMSSTSSKRMAEASRPTTPKTWLTPASLRRRSSWVATLSVSVWFTGIAFDLLNHGWVGLPGSAGRADHGQAGTPGGAPKHGRGRRSISGVSRPVPRGSRNTGLRLPGDTTAGTIRVGRRSASAALPGRHYQEERNQSGGLSGTAVQRWPEGVERTIARDFPVGPHARKKTRPPSMSDARPSGAGRIGGFTSGGERTRHIRRRNGRPPESGTGGR